MNISYDSYRVFYYVAKYHSFTQAAVVLMSNQPNVTRTIKNLEQALGCKLFIRSSRGRSSPRRASSCTPTSPWLLRTFNPARRSWPSAGDCTAAW